MTEAIWLRVAVIGGALVAFLWIERDWIERELWMRRRRERRRRME